MNHRNHERLKDRIFKIIEGRLKMNEGAPTIKELQEATGLRSSASVHEILKELEREKKIKIIPNVSRGIRLVQDNANDETAFQVEKKSGSTGTYERYE